MTWPSYSGGKASSVKGCTMYSAEEWRVMNEGWGWLVRRGGGVCEEGGW